jgi:hypothetical protein
MYEIPFCDVKFDIWYALSAKKITDPVFYTKTINSDTYVKQTVQPFEVIDR